MTTETLEALENLTANEAKRRVEAELMWAFAKTNIEPHIQEASNDDTALGLLPNHEFLIRCPYPTLTVKCRKTAHSWGIAAKALCRAATVPRSTTIIGSFDEDEAKDKNNFLEWQYGVLDAGWRQELKMSPGSEERRFANGSRIKFISRKAPTGAGAAILWDEFSVEPKGGATAAEILVAAIGCNTHGGTIDLGGTQRGAETMFYKIASGEFARQAEADPLFQSLPKIRWKVKTFYWWLSPALCVDVEAAALVAPHLSTPDRVAKFGNEKLKVQFVSYCTTPDLGIEMFQREFECAVLDDKESYFSLEFLEKCYPHQDENYWFHATECDGKKEVYKSFELIDEIALAIRHNQIPGGDWGAAMDVGRHVDHDEIAIGHNLTEDRKTALLRANIGMSDMPFPQKQAVWTRIMERLPITRGYIDGTRGSMGVQLAEWAYEKYSHRANTFQFTQANKQIISSGVKARGEQHKLVLPRFEKLQKQMLRVKKVESATGNVTFDVARNNTDHGDLYWAMAMWNDLYEKPDNSMAAWAPGTVPASLAKASAFSLPAGSTATVAPKLILPGGVR